MDKAHKIALLRNQLELAKSAAEVLQKSLDRSKPLLQKGESTLTDAEKETLESLTARYSRLSDLIIQKVFRTIDQIELSDEGSMIDRLNRMEKRGIIPSAKVAYQMRELRNQISHEYLIEQSDAVVKNSILFAPELIQTVENINQYSKRFIEG
jgi:hypothetical protein